MRPPESFVRQPVRSLQTMLRVIAEDNPRQPTVIPDGIYGSSTQNAVAAFQRAHGLSVTGVTDQDTWEAIVAEYEPAMTRTGPAQVIEVILEPGQIIRQGQKDPNIYLVQAILQVLSELYSSVSPPAMNGTLDTPTAEALAAFQAISGLPQTGELDRITWKHLALQYPLAANQYRTMDIAKEF